MAKGDADDRIAMEREQIERLLDRRGQYDGARHTRQRWFRPMSLSDMSDKRRTTILTVEDESLISEFLGDVLRDAGYEVVATYNASDAIGILERSDDISLVITDINMPGSMDGLRLAKAVRGRWPPVKIIIATGRTRPESDQMPRGSVFLAKPYDSQAIIAAVQGLV